MDHDEEVNRLCHSGQQIIKTILAFGELFDQAIAGLDKLSKSPAIRKAMMGLPPSFQVDVSLRTVLGLHCEINSEHPPAWLQWLDLGNSDMYRNLEAALRKRKAADGNAARSEAQRRQEVASQLFKDPAISTWCQTHYPNVWKKDVLQKSEFLLGLIGENVISEGGQMLTMSVIFMRLDRVEEEITNGWDMRSLAGLSRVWMPSNTDAMLLEIEEQWQRQFVTVISQGGYLDTAAGVTFPGCESRNDSERGVANGRMISFGSGGEPLGGLIDWTTKCFSPEFISYFNNDALPTMGFIPDPDHSGSSGRRFRCESPYASQRSPPIYFQMGSPPKAKLFQACETTKFGDAVLKICNYVEGLRYAFFCDCITKRYGKRMVGKYCPAKKEYDLLFVTSSSSKSFSWHTDARHMLYDDSGKGNNRWWQDCYLRVMTVFFSNDECEGNVHIKYRRQSLEDCKGGTRSYTLGCNGIHEQGLFTQKNLEHAIECSPQGKHRRHVFTARSTRHLQVSGLHNLRSRQENIAIVGPKYDCYIGNDAACLPCSWELPTLSNNHEVEAPSLHSRQRLFLGGQATNSTSSTSTPPLHDLRDAIFYDKQPAVEEAIDRYNLVEVSTSMTNLLAGGAGYARLLNRKVSLKVSSRGQTIPYGPCPNFNAPDSFAMVGQFFPADIIRQYYGVPNSKQYSPAWAIANAALSSLHLSKRYKSPLRRTESPLSEVVRILQNKAREGFSFFLSGGNDVEVSAIGPTVDKPTLVSYTSGGVMLKTPKNMSVRSSENTALMEASMTGRVVSVFFSEQFIPRTLQKSSTADGGIKEMCMHAGLYQMNLVELRGPLSGDEISSQIAEAEADAARFGDFSSLQVQHLCFLQAAHFVCKLVPIEEGSPQEGENPASWTDMLVPLPCKDHLAFQVPESFSAKDLAVATGCVPSREELVSTYVRSHDTALVDGGGMDDPTKNGPKVVLCTTKVTQYGPDDVVDILLRLLVGYNMRLSRLNVDVQGRLSTTLSDQPTSQDSSFAEKATTLFGNGTIGLCAALGTNVTKNSYPCPFPQGDSKVLFLMMSNMTEPFKSFKEARLGRSGVQFIMDNPDEVARMFIQSFITETTGNSVTNGLWWAAYKELHNLTSDYPRLPGTPEQFSHYLSFIESFARQRQGNLHDFLQHHYKLPPCLVHMDSYRAILEFVVGGATNLVSKIVDKCLPLPSQNRRQAVLEQLSNFLSHCMSGSGSDPSFLSGRVLANVEELISGNPFGVVDEVPFGFGALQGMRLINWKEVEEYCCNADPTLKPACCNGGTTVDHKRMVTLFLKVLELTLTKHDNDWYGWLYTESGKVYHRINGRELNAVDVDQPLCKVYIYRENDPGGGRSNTKRSTQRPHCFPNKLIGSTWIEGMAERCLEGYRKEYLHCGIQCVRFRKQWAEESIQLSDEECLQVKEDPHCCTVYTNDYEANITLPPHRYHTRTFASRKTWEEAAKALGKGMEECRLSVLENGSPGLLPGEVHFFEDSPVVNAAVHAADEVVQGFLNQGLRYNFSNTFTLHQQSIDSINQVTAHYYHVDKKTLSGGRVMIYPLQGISYLFVSTPKTCRRLKDDSRNEFEQWKKSLSGDTLKQVNGYVASFKKYARKHHGQEQMYVYKLIPGQLLAFDSRMLCHGSIVPCQQHPRKILLFHRLQLL